MKSLNLLLTVFVMLLFVSFVSLQAQDESPTVTPDYTIYTIFPYGLDCSDMDREIAIGPTWRNIVVGESTIQDLEDAYGEVYSFFDMLTVTGEDFSITLCASNDVITALKVESDLQYFEDFVRIHGEPDAITNDLNADTVLAFWFEQGIAISVWINTSSEEYFGRVGALVYFPFQEIVGYQERWPYTSTAQELGFAESTEPRNPFNYTEMWATLTLRPTFTPSPTYAPLMTKEASLTITPTPTTDE